MKLPKSLLGFNLIAKTFRIDYEIFEWLLRESQRTGIPYQTLMNSKLKMCMDQEKSSAPVTADQVAS